MRARPPGDSLVRATLWTGAMIAAFLLQMIAVRELSENLGVFQICSSAAPSR